MNEGIFGFPLGGQARKALAQTIFTASGVWAKPAIGTIAVIEVWSGGNAGSTGSGVGASGIGGSYATVTKPLSSLAELEAVVVGAVAAGYTWFGGASYGGSINPGNSSSFGSHLTVGGATSGAAAYITSALSTNVITSSFETGPTTGSAPRVFKAGGAGQVDGTPAVTSLFGGQGGASSTDGTAPGGGGGAVPGGNTGTSGAGARGEVRVTVY